MKPANFIISVTCILFLSVNTALLQAQTYEIRIDAGGFDRLHSVVSFYFPEEIKPGSYTVTGSDGDTRSLQVDERNRGWLIVEELSKSESKSYRFDGESNAADAGYQMAMDEDILSISSAENHVLSYFYGYNSPPQQLDERYKRGGYIHPVSSPGGVKLTNHLNPDQHPHHSGIWSAWTRTEFQGRNPDFWNVHENSGRVDHTKKPEKVWEGPVFTGFKSKHHFTDLSAAEPVTALNEEWKVRVFSSPAGFHIFDLISIQTTNLNEALVLPEYRYGGIGFRGHQDWDDPENCTFLTSEGEGREGHGSRVNWTHIGGQSDGKLAGITIMSHPSNFRHPQPVRIHPDEPFFNFAPQQLGDMAIEPGSPYRSEYRYITYDGEPNPDELNRLWNDFAYPPGVTVLKTE